MRKEDLETLLAVKRNVNLFTVAAIASTAIPSAVFSAIIASAAVAA